MAGPTTASHLPSSEIYIPLSVSLTGQAARPKGRLSGLRIKNAEFGALRRTGLFGRVALGPWAWISTLRRACRL